MIATKNNPKQFIPKRVLGIAAHADDLEYIAGGSVAKWAAEGAEIYFLILTNGDKGSPDAKTNPGDLRDLRIKEQRHAAEVLGVKKVFFGNYEDGALVVNMDIKREIARTIRTVKPDTVITWDPTMAYSVLRRFINHPDHIAAGEAALAAVFPLARDPLSFPELLQQEKLEPHKVSTALLFNFDNPNFFVDIATTLPTKLQARAAHESQATFDPNSPSDITTVAKDFGRQAGLQYAEAFVRIDID